MRLAYLAKYQSYKCRLSIVEYIAIQSIKWQRFHLNYKNLIRSLHTNSEYKIYAQAIACHFNGLPAKLLHFMCKFIINRT